MKKIIFLALFASLSAFAANEGPGSAVFDYTFFGNTAGRYTMVSCDYATPIAQEWMEALGATNVSVLCRGGIGPFGVTPLDIRATYSAPILTGATRSTALKIASGTFPGDSNCDFDTGIMNALLADFTNAQVVRRWDTCLSPDSAYSYDLTVVLPQSLRR